MEKKLCLNKTYVNYITNRLDTRGYYFISTIIYKMVSFIEGSFIDIENILNSGSINDESLVKEFTNMLRLMERKFEHMLQVIDISINLSAVKNYESYQEIANILVSTFHDFGRILEIHNIGTAMGTNKVNHSTLGLSYLFNNDNQKYEKLREYLCDELYLVYRDIIYTGIKYHGTMDVPYEQLSVFKQSVVRDIRDADKLAVMSSFVDPNTDMYSVFHMGFAELAQLPIHDISVEEILNHKQIDRSNKSIPYDRMRQFISHIGFIFDINCPLLYDYLYQSRWVERYISHIKPYLIGDNLAKMDIIEAECIKYLQEHYTQNEDAINIGYKTFKK